MPKGKRLRSKAEYEKEIEDAVKRFRKYPERILASEDSESWQDFLLNIGVNPVNIENGQDFWDSVREKTYNDTRPKQSETISNRLISYITATEKGLRYIETTSKGSQYREVYKNHRIVYRDISTGRFTKRNEQ